MSTKVSTRVSTGTARPVVPSLQTSLDGGDNHWLGLPDPAVGVVADTLRMAWFRRWPPPGLIVHTDRGSQYCGEEFQKALAG